MTMPAKEARNSLEKSGLSGRAARREPFFVSRAERRRVIAASSVGTVFEWYDFYLYAVLAPFFARLFFPPENETAALLAAFRPAPGMGPTVLSQSHGIGVDVVVEKKMRSSKSEIRDKFKTAKQKCSKPLKSYHCWRNLAGCVSSLIQMPHARF